MLPAPYFNQNRTPNLAKLVFIFLSLIFLSARFSDLAIRQWPDSKRSDPGNSSNAAQVEGNSELLILARRQFDHTQHPCAANDRRVAISFPIVALHEDETNSECRATLSSNHHFRRMTE